MKTMITRHECLSCGNRVTYHIANDVYVCFTCEYIEDAEDFALHLEHWDNQIAEAARDDAIDNARDAERMAAYV